MRSGEVVGGHSVREDMADAEGGRFSDVTARMNPQTWHDNICQAPAQYQFYIGFSISIIGVTIIPWLDTIGLILSS